MLSSSPESIAAFEQRLYDICALFRPPEKLSVAQWADKHLYLSQESSARPGKYHVSTAEYQREPLECLSPGSGYDTVVQCWSSQTGKTMNALSLTGYHTHHDPAPLLFLEPDENLAKAIAQDRIGPMIRDTPVLAALFGKGKGQGNDLMHKSFPGGQIDIGWASSPTGLASRPKRIVITDEEDGYVLATNKEGNPVQIVTARMATYSELNAAMHLRVSSPRLLRTSLIWPAFLKSDQRYYHVPCPQCGHMQTLRWEQLKRPMVDGKPDNEACYYVCEGSGCEILHADKFRMVKLGKWISLNPAGKGRTAGFHLNALYSTIGFSWARLLDKYDECEGLPERLQVFTNTLLGLPWDEQAEGADMSTIQRRAEEYPAPAPAWVLVITCGADVQKDRIEATKWGWGLNEVSGVIEHRIFRGDVLKQPEVWHEFEAWRQLSVEHESGLQLPVACTFIDSGDGQRTQTVYNYTGRRERFRVFASKGSSLVGAPAVNRGNRVGKGRVLVVSVGTSTIKDTLYGRLGIEDRTRPGYVHFPSNPHAGCDSDFFQHLTAERLVTRQTKSGEKSTWENPNKRNEALDCAVYALAAKEFIRPNLMECARQIANRSARALLPERNIPVPTSAVNSTSVTASTARTSQESLPTVHPFAPPATAFSMKRKAKRVIRMPGHDWIHRK